MVVRSVSVVISTDDGSEARSWGSSRLMRSTTPMMLAPGLALDVHDHRRLVVHPGRLLHVLDAVDHVGDVGEAHGRAVPVGDDERRVLGGREELIVGADA